jgi:hypothetical protein
MVPVHRPPPRRRRKPRRKHRPPPPPLPCHRSRNSSHRHSRPVPRLVAVPRPLQGLPQLPPSCCSELRKSPALMLACRLLRKVGRSQAEACQPAASFGGLGLTSFCLAATYLSRPPAGLMRQRSRKPLQLQTCSTNLGPRLPRDGRRLRDGRQLRDGRRLPVVPLHIADSRSRRLHQCQFWQNKIL